MPADVVRCPCCDGPVTTCAECGIDAFILPDDPIADAVECPTCEGDPVHATDVLPDLLRAWLESDCRAWTGTTGDRLHLFIEAALAKLGYPTRESIEAAIDDMKTTRTES